MLVYHIENFPKGYEQDQARIEFEVAKEWLWPPEVLNPSIHERGSPWSMYT